MAQKLKSEKKTLQEYQVEDNKRGKMLLGSIIATLIAITPYLFYLYESVPQQKFWSTFLFTYESKGWENAYIVFWVYMSKLIPLFLLFIWFFTCRHWWYHTLLVPIAMYVFQLFMVINDDILFVDSFEIIYIIPMMIIIVPSIYLIRARIFNTVNNVDKEQQDLEDELKIKPDNVWKKISNYF